MKDPDSVTHKKMVALVSKITEELKVDELPEDALDSLVHDCASEQASEINNGGYSTQLDYLLRNGWKPADIIFRVKQAMEECDCQSPDTNPAGVSNDCPIHGDE